MFNIGWGEVLFLVLIVLILVGPDRLPQTIRDLRKTLNTLRDAITSTKESLEKEVGPEFQEIARPVQEISKFTAMGPKAALTKALFDGDGSYLDAFDPKKIMASDTQGAAYRAGSNANPQPTGFPQPNTPQGYVQPGAQLVSPQQVPGQIQAQMQPQHADDAQSSAYSAGPAPTPASIASPDQTAQTASQPAPPSAGQWDDVI